MKHSLKVYDLILTVKGPVHIGNGLEIKKKEYIYFPERKKVMIPKLETMYSDILKLHKQKEFEAFMLHSNITLKEWIEQQRIPMSHLEKWKWYELDCGDMIEQREKPVQIMACIKDAYGMPYVPGSSLKGMLRTILLSYDIKQHPEKYQEIKEYVYQSLRKKVKRTEYLSYEAKKMETIGFHTLSRKDKKEEIVNDYMAGLQIGDSLPLTTDDLTLCEKLEYHVDGTEKRLNLLRECLKPGTKIHVPLTIDTQLCNINDTYIMNAVRDFSENYQRVFSSKFPNIDPVDSTTVWLGGGAGYVSKTVIYALFGKDSVKIIPAIFKGINVADNHGHNKDIQMGVSPHILKLTEYQGKKYPFGECLLEMQERIL